MTSHLIAVYFYGFAVTRLITHKFNNISNLKIYLEANIEKNNTLCLNGKQTTSLTKSHLLTMHFTQMTDGRLDGWKGQSQ